MQSLKNWLITALLKKDKLVAVPQSWQNDYVRMAGDEYNKRQTIVSLMNEYNGLLKDYFDKCSVKELQDTLKDAGAEVKTTMTKQELVDKAYEEFKMAIEKD